MLKQLQVQDITESDRQVRWSLNIAVEEEMLYGKKWLYFCGPAFRLKALHLPVVQRSLRSCVLYSEA